MSVNCVHVQSDFTSLISKTRNDCLVQNPSSLCQIVLNTICKLLNVSVKNVDLEFEKVQKYSKINSLTASGIFEDASMVLMLSIMKIKRYIQNLLTSDVRTILLNHALTYCVMCKSIAIIRLVITMDIEDVDLRGLHFWKTKNTVPQWWVDELNIKRKETRFSRYLASIIPPNEFDWHSADRMGRVMSFNDVIEFFSILKSVKCGEHLKSLKINSRRETLVSVHKNYEKLISELFSRCTSLTTLIFRGAADDKLLKVIGKSMTSLKLLDVSYSKFVTDEGIKQLFCKQFTDTPSPDVHTSSPTNTKICNDMSMNQLSTTVCYLDFSYTGVTAESLKYVRSIPGSFLFKRSFALSENLAYGHAIFLRHKTAMTRTIKTADAEFRYKLKNLVGKVAEPQFNSLAKSLKWQDKCLDLFRLKDENKDTESRFPELTVGIVTSEGFVNGMFKIQNRKVNYIYTDTPFNLNAFGGIIMPLEVIQGVMLGTIASPESFCTVKIVNLLAEPSTLLAVLKFLPNLVKVAFRIISKPIQHEDLIGAISSSNSRFNLQEFWMAPGWYKQKTVIPQVVCSRGSLLGHGGNSELEQLCKLNVATVKTLFKICPRLLRVGDLAWWSLVSPEELALFCRYLQKKNCSAVIIFDDILLPDFELLRQL